MAGSASADHEFDNDGELILTGSANAYVATTARKIKGYYQGLRLCGRANFTCTGASTITVDEAGAIPIRKPGNVATANGDIVNGTYYDFIYDIANNVMQVVAAPGSGSISNAELADMATQTIKARKTAGTGAPEDCTLSEVLDFIGSAAQGDILYRGASAWARLGAGTSGQFLKTNGAAANPAWAGAAVTPISEGALSAVSTLDITLGSADMYEIDLIDFAPATDNVSLFSRFSQSSSFLSGASDYRWGYIAASTQNDDAADSEIEILNGQGNATTEKLSITFRIYRPSATSFYKSMRWTGIYGHNTDRNFPTAGGGFLILNTNAIDGVRFLFSSGNIGSGYYAVRSYSFT